MLQAAFSISPSQCTFIMNLAIRVQKFTSCTTKTKEQQTKNGHKENVN